MEPTNLLIYFVLVVFAILGLVTLAKSARIVAQYEKGLIDHAAGQVTNLRHVLDEATNAWGVKVTRVEVQKIDPPVDITEAMSRQMKAERDKRAAILESEGIKQSQILQAEGIKQSEILKAEGDAQARITRANAEAEAVRLVSTAAENYFKERAETMRRLEVLNNTLGQNTKYIVPSNASLVNVLGLDAVAPLIKGKGGDATTAPASPSPGPRRNP
ncbi:MAG: hypothetical protein DMG29_01710 [Acidobacteria bacterium]|nr:MAG: hypothetical protein DMG29_01710 [Acidobacteriota bacterium]